MNSFEPEKKLKTFGNFQGFLEDVACPICPAPPKPELIFRKREGINIMLCPKCNLYYATPIFDEPSLMNIYENEAFSDMSVYNNWSYESWSRSGSRGWFGSNLKVQLVKRYLKNNQAILDVGCGTGEFIAVAIRNQLDAEGIDMSSVLINVGKNKLNVPVRQIDIKEFRPQRLFDGIVIWDVLEHLNDPVQMLKSCAALLKPNGFIFAQVPNRRGLSNRLKSFACRTGLSKNDFGHFGFPYHLHFYEKHSLRHLFKASGYTVIHFESWSHLLKDGKSGFFTNIIISVVKKYCFSDYIIVVAQKHD